jgi:tetratricopeptide (TPR) repeat protein
LRAQGDFAAARPLYERALAIFEKALGPDHPDTATTLNNLAFLLRAQGDFAAARPLAERARAIREKALGPDHPDTATSLNNPAFLLQAQSDFAAARPLFERALAIREKALGPDHPDTGRSLTTWPSGFGRKAILRRHGRSSSARWRSSRRRLAPPIPIPRRCEETLRAGLVRRERARTPRPSPVLATTGIGCST